MPKKETESDKKIKALINSGRFSEEQRDFLESKFSDTLLKYEDFSIFAKPELSTELMEALASALECGTERDTVIKFARVDADPKEIHRNTVKLCCKTLGISGLHAF